MQKLRKTSAYALRVVSEDLLEEVYFDAPPMVGVNFGEVVKMDRSRNGKEANTLGAWVFPGLGANTLEEEAFSEEQSSPTRGRRRPLKKPYAPVFLPRPRIEIKPQSKKQVPSSYGVESEEETED